MGCGFDATKISADANVNFEKDFYVGATIEHNLTKATESAVSFVKKDGTNKYWLNYDVTKTTAGLGCLVNYAEKNFTHVYEAKFNPAEVQLFHQPLIVAGAGRYVLSKDSSLTYSVEFAKETSAQIKFDHKLDKNWKVSVAQSYDCNRLVTKRAPYDLGFNVAYTL